MGKTLKDWLPQVLAYLIAALLAYGRMDTRVTLLEVQVQAIKVEHDRRLQLIEDQMRNGQAAVMVELQAIRAELAVRNSKR